jgi:hypothetical protein
VRPIFVSLGILVTPLSAYADDPPTSAPAVSATAGTTTMGERVTVPASRVLIRADVGINLSTDTAGDPISIAPDVWYGVNDKLTVGLVHSFVAITGFMGIPIPAGICIGDACGNAYTTVGGMARYTLSQNKNMAVAVEGGAIAFGTDPLELSIKLGIAGRYRVNKQLAIDFQPALFFGATERDGGNKELVVLPVTAVYGINKKVGLLLQSGVAFPFEDADQQFFIPVTVGGTYAVNQQVSLYAAFSLPFLAGGDAFPTGVDGRVFSIGGGYAL